jgi:putative transposase
MTYNPQIHHRRSIRLKEYDYSQAGLYFITICCHEKKCRFGEIDTVGAGFTPAQYNNISDTGERAGVNPAPTATMVLNEYGKIAYHEWLKLPERFANFEMDVFQIMPNHIHVIILLNTVGAGFTPAQKDVVAQNDDNITNATVGAGFTPAQKDVDNFTNAGERAGVNPAPTGAPNQNCRDAIVLPQKSPAQIRINDIIGVYKSLAAKGCLNIYKSNNQKMGKLWQRNYYEHIIRDDKTYQTISEYIINNPSNWADDKFYQQ